MTCQSLCLACQRGNPTKPRHPDHSCLSIQHLLFPSIIDCAYMLCTARQQRLSSKVAHSTTLQLCKVIGRVASQVPCIPCLSRSRDVTTCDPQGLNVASAPSQEVPSTRRTGALHKKNELGLTKGALCEEKAHARVRVHNITASLNDG